MKFNSLFAEDEGAEGEGGETYNQEEIGGGGGASHNVG